MKVKTKEELIENPEDLRPHVVLLGAGASLAAFFKGDVNGKRLPVMANFVQILELEQDLRNHHIDPSGNFEEIYSNISDDSLKNKIENKIHQYFSQLQLPDKVTDYDRLLLSLRNKDSIFTFNWDPFLFDAYMRNYNQAINLPEIFFLHGNVRLVSCSKHYKVGYIRGICEECNNAFIPVPLLYPIEKKNYQDSINYIKTSWEEAQNRFTNAFTITIFGYGAPTSDVEAVELLQNAWLARSPRQLEHIEIIDVADEITLTARWAAFAPTGHYHIVNSLRESRLWKWPRRTCEALFYPMSKGIPCEAFPLPDSEEHKVLQEYIANISKHEANT